MTKSTMTQDTKAGFVGIALTFGLSLLIWLTAPLLADVPHLKDQGASWYFWQLPERTFWGKLSAWGFYGLHQIVIWWLIFKAQSAKVKYSHQLHNFNWMALGANFFFCVLHIVQTHIWYDGLAQHVSIWSALGSVAIMLIWILLMETPRRGLFFGKKINFSKNLIRAAKKYHGYYFSWAIIYTFWYHPTEATWGHLMGFSYIFLLLVQGSLFFTRFHLNRIWTFVLEVWVVLHGTIVALESPHDLWGMFFFGFLGIFVVTQMYGLGLSRFQRWFLSLAYIAGAIALSLIKGPIFLTAVPRIPIIDYLGVFLLAGIIWGITKLIPTKSPSS